MRKILLMIVMTLFHGFRLQTIFPRLLKGGQRTWKIR